MITYCHVAVFKQTTEANHVEHHGYIIKLIMEPIAHCSSISHEKAELWENKKLILVSVNKH